MALGSSSRLFIEHFLGLEANGIFAVAMKFSTILETFSVIVYQAWQETAIKQYGAADRSKFFFQNIQYIYSHIVRFSADFCFRAENQLFMAGGFSLFRELAIFISDVYLGNLFCIGIVLRFGLSMFEADREKSAGSDYYNGIEFNHELCLHSFYGYLGNCPFVHSFLSVYAWFPDNRYVEIFSGEGIDGNHLSDFVLDRRGDSIL